ncbi:hypothetical protein SUGI_0362940 [Cryptomeria japonica]|nr:hypothetical protein SUGI_0362940 [Cryptomeria japonica]
MMLSRVLTTTRGTSGYLAPEWLWGLPSLPRLMCTVMGNTIDIVEEGVLLAEKADIEEARRAIVVKGVLLAEKADIEEARRAIVVWVAMH